MSEVKVNLAERSYHIKISTQWLGKLGEALRDVIPEEKILVISDKQVARLYGDAVLEVIRKAGFEAEIHAFPEGEKNKNLKTLETIYDILIENDYPRTCSIVALGGGVPGDAAGFAAATYMRGVHYVQIPTSLLAMVDSSVGGKTAVNHKLGKNLIGSFYQPELVFIDTAFLTTLAEDEFRSGLGEVIKYGIIRDADFFSWLSDEIENLCNGDSDVLEQMVTRCCQIKADIVSQDERESGIRAILNFGHTFGHAIEALTGYGHYRHGEAVAIGMIAASRVALVMDMIGDIDVQMIWQIIVKSGLPYRIGDLEPEEILKRMKKDKKVKGGKIRYVLPARIGKVVIRDDVPDKFILKVLDDMKQ